MVTHKTVTKLLPIPGISNTYVLFTGNVTNRWQPSFVLINRSPLF